MSDEPIPVRAAIEEARRHLGRVPFENGDEPTPAEIEQARRDGLEALAQQRWAGTIPSRFLAAQIEDFGNTTTPDILSDWAHDTTPSNLVIFGPTGTGKTHAAVAACRSLHFARRQEVSFWPVPKLLDALRPGGSMEHRLEDLALVDVLVLDDVGAERPSEWTTERLHILVNDRWLEQRRTIATTNLEVGGDDSPLAKAIGLRTYSRLVGSEAVVLRMTGQDRRRR